MAMSPTPVQTRNLAARLRPFPEKSAGRQFKFSPKLSRRLGFLAALALLVMLAATRPAHAACTAGISNANMAESTPSSAFVDHGNGTVTHPLTGLMWKQCGEGLSGTGCSSGTATPMSWATALGSATTANTAGFAGFSDWRLPNKKELESIVEVCGYAPAINRTIFPGIVSSAEQYWSATPTAASPTYVWSVSFLKGNTSAYLQSSSYFVRLVRSGQTLDSYDLLLSPQTITSFSTLPSLIVGATGTLTATASSGLAVTFSSLTPSICSVSGSTVTGLGTGACTVAANQTGNSSTSAAPQVTQNVSVAPHSYSKIANSGSVLPDSAVLGSGAGDWACTRDNTTGLIWEVKTTDGGLRDWNKGYTNYDDPTQAQKQSGSNFVNPTQAEIDAASNSIGLINAVNTNAIAL